MFTLSYEGWGLYTTRGDNSFNKFDKLVLVPYCRAPKYNQSQREPVYKFDNLSVRVFDILIRIANLFVEVNEGYKLLF